MHGMKTMKRRIWMITTKKVGMFLFDGVASMDFTGPYEVFTMANFDNPHPYFDVFTVAEEKGDVHVAGGLIVNAKYDLTDCPQADILVIPGGIVTKELLANDSIINWIKEQNKKTEITFSVCNGALLIAKAGLLKGLSATTHHFCYDQLVEIDPDIHLIKKIRYVDNGKIITSAGIDAALHLVLRLYGEEAASKTIAMLEYESTAYKDSGTSK
jgi:transcriptional regulator GlxA family with amidase domain